MLTDPSAAERADVSELKGRPSSRDTPELHGRSKTAEMHRQAGRIQHGEELALCQQQDFNMRDDSASGAPGRLLGCWPWISMGGLTTSGHESSDASSCAMYEGPKALGDTSFRPDIALDDLMTIGTRAFLDLPRSSEFTQAVHPPRHAGHETVGQAGRLSTPIGSIISVIPLGL